jgi:hypothetical protein
LIQSFGLVLMYLPFGSLGVFMKAIKKKNYHWVWGNLL